MTSLQIIRLVAMREVVVRGRSKGFIISTAIIVVAIIAGSLAFQFADRFFDDLESRYQLGILDVEPDPAFEAALDAASRFGLVIDATTFDDLEEAELALADGDVDAVLIDRRSIRFHGQLIDQLWAVATEAVRVLRLPGQLDELGLTYDELLPILEPAPLEVSIMEPEEEVDAASFVVASAATILLFVAILTYGQWVLLGVVEEKSSRIVEVLLSTIRPYQLLAGKVAGILVLAMFQLVVLLVVSLAMLTALHDMSIPAVAAWGVAAAVVWFVLGLVFYGLAYGVAGALVSRQEESSNVVMPFVVLLGLGYFATIAGVMNNPSGTLAIVVSLVPFTAPIAMPVRVALGEVTAWEFALSVLLMLATIVVAVRLGGRIYAGAVLRVGPRVALRDAWRFSR
jgi:ABC-2 type transport system permease protein